MKILVAYDGTVHAKKALTYGLNKVRSLGGELLAVQVFDPSLFIDYDAGPMAEDLSRREAAGNLNEARQLISEQAGNFTARIVSEEGNAETIISRLAAEEKADLVLLAPRYKKLFAALPCQAMMVPGVVVVPVDNRDAAPEHIDMIAKEAASTGSQVLLVGIVPVNLYSREEKQELEQVKKDTSSAVGSLRKRLGELGINASEEMRFGYPDLEILRAAEEHRASLIILPSGGAMPSELSKAAAILLEEPRGPAQPFVLIDQARSA